MMRKLLIALLVPIVGVGLFYLHDAFLNALRMQRIPKNFSVVKPGVLYRSGQMRPEHFRRVLAEHNIKTVVCLNPKDEPAEPLIADQLNVDYVTYTMPGSGQGKPEYFHDFLRLMGDEQRWPVLVHCAAGAYRTGVAVGLYRMHFEGWRIEDVMKEMHYSGCQIYGDQPLIDHLVKTYETIPDDVRDQVWPTEQVANRE